MHHQPQAGKAEYNLQEKKADPPAKEYCLTEERLDCFTRKERGLGILPEPL
jgi:hypothetical protein